MLIFEIVDISVFENSSRLILCLFSFIRAMLPRQAPRNPDEIFAQDRNSCAGYPEVLAAVALGAPVAQPNLEAGALL